MLPVMLIDRDLVYVQRLAERLQSLLDGVVHAHASDDPKLEQEITALASQGLIVLAEPAICRWLQQAAPDWPTVHWIDWQTQSDRPANPSDLIYRLMPASQIAAALTHVAADWASPVVQKSQPENIRTEPLSLLTVALDLGWPGHRAFVKDWLRQQRQSGREVYYLPLMPNYRMSLLKAPGPGPNLTQLLLRLANGEALSTADLGAYLEPNPRGFWQFRPPERSDDLVQADPSWLRAIGVLIREKIRETDTARNPDTHQPAAAALIDCHGLSFSRIAQILMLADVLAVRLENGTDWASQVARKELGELIARLPGSCQVQEIHAPDPADPNHPTHAV